MPTKKLFAMCMLVVFLGAGCGGPSAAQLAATKPVTLKIWRVYDPNSNFTGLEKAYRTIHPNVSFDYKEFDTQTFKQELLRALAEGTGPDIFSINNAWLGEYKSLIEPMPASIKIPYSETRGTIKKETVYTIKEQPSLSLRQLKADYVDVVAADVIQTYQPNTKTKPADRVFGLPLSVDTLAMFYNKDLLNAGGFPNPAKTWTEFQDQVSKLTKLGENNSIIQSGAAIGTSKNVERSSDILSLLMMQNGTQMADDRGRALFAHPASDATGTVLGLAAASFYTDFANPTKQVYTWNKDQPSSFDAFTAGKTAYFFGYSYHISPIRAAAPKLKFSITPVPQIEGGRAVNFANYWIETVSKASINKDFAWDFIQFSASKDHVQLYLTPANKPTALRSLIGTQMENDNLVTFVSQLLTAKSWYKGTDAAVAENAMQDFIDQILAGENATKAIQAAENKVNQTL